jgi:hypothetical protein
LTNFYGSLIGDVPVQFLGVMQDWQQSRPCL